MESVFTKLLLDFKSIPKHKRHRTFMEISGYPHYENVCSNILMFYLDPTNEHGLEDLVLNSIIKGVEDDFRFDLDFEKIEINREILTKQNNRLDLLILTEKYAIGIENKIFHHLHNDLKDYYETIKSFCLNSRIPISLVLSLNKLTSKNDLEKLKASSFINITYEDLFINIKSNIGKYIKPTNISYVNHLTDFIKSIENLTPKTMENKNLWAFFKNNSDAIQELTDNFNEYKNSIFQKVFLLNGILPKDEFAPSADKQWIYRGCVLVHDYTIDDKFKIAIDSYIDLNGWEITLFGRNSQSMEFLCNVMCKQNNLLPNPFESYQLNDRNDRIIYHKFDTNTEISEISEVLSDLLNRIENFKNNSSISKTNQDGITISETEISLN